MFRRLNLIKSGRDGAVYGEKVIILNTFFVVWTMYQALWESYLPKQYSHNLHEENWSRFTNSKHFNRIFFTEKKNISAFHCTQWKLCCLETLMQLIIRNQLFHCNIYLPKLTRDIFLPPYMQGHPTTIFGKYLFRRRFEI